MQELARIVIDNLNKKEYSAFANKAEFKARYRVIIDLLKKYRDGIALDLGKMFSHKDMLASHLQLHTVHVLDLLIREFENLPDRISDIIENKGEEVEESLD